MIKHPTLYWNSNKKMTLLSLQSNITILSLQKKKQNPIPITIGTYKHLNDNSISDGDMQSVPFNTGFIIRLSDATNPYLL